MSLDFGPEFGTFCQITLETGRRVTLRMLHQGLTYGSLPDAIPTKEMNDELLKSVFQEASLACAKRQRPYLLAPARRNFRRNPFDMQDWEHFEPEWLPCVWCIGEFVSEPIAPARRYTLSRLIVVWFQDSFAPPVSPIELAAITHLDWEGVAANL